MELKNNDLLEGSSGRFGKKLVYRQRGEKTIIARRPAKTKSTTAKQQAIKERFYEAVLYAKAVINDPIQKAVYQEKSTLHKSAYNVALADFCKAPEIRKYNLTTYIGLPGDQIIVRVVDDFKVVQVTVAIKCNKGTIIESGPAVQSGNGLDWIYTVTAVNATIAGTTVIFAASDIPGNETVQEVVLE